MGKSGKEAVVGAVTQKVIAKKLGISQITVSRVLNQSPAVSPLTREMVLREMGKAGYTMNRNARNLVGKRKGTIGVVFPRIDNMGSIYFLPTLMGIGQGINAHHLLMHIVPSLDDTSPLEAVDGIRGQVDGFIIFNLGSRSDFVQAMAGHLRRQAIAHVLIQSYKGAGYPHVTIDNHMGGVKAAAHLLELGHSRLAYLGIGGVSDEDSERRDGFAQECEKSGAAFEPEWSSMLSKSSDMPAVLGKWMRRRVAKRPSAFFTYSDRMARLLVFACEREGVKVPGDLSIVGFDDMPAYSMMTEPSLSTIRQPFLKLGLEAVRVVLDNAPDSGEDSAAACSIEPELMVRGTSGPPI